MNISRPREYYSYIIDALKSLGGSGRNNEILEKVIELANLSDEETDRIHTDGRTTVVSYNLSWAKTYLKRFGLLEISSRGVWNLTEEGFSDEMENPDVIVAHVRNLHQQTRFNDQEQEIGENHLQDIEEETGDNLFQNSDDWQQNLKDKVLSVSPAGFERLCQRIFREKGFEKVEVTGSSGDGGIDGTGIIKFSLLSFKVVFQCKRYRGSVGPDDIRSLRGAMRGNADKGIFLTTGHFTRGAIAEASRLGNEQIELIDGQEICELLYELKLGIITNEIIVIDEDFFNNFN